MSSGSCVGIGTPGWRMFAPPRLGAAAMLHPQNSAFRGGKQGVNALPGALPTRTPPENDTVTLVGVQACNIPTSGYYRKVTSRPDPIFDTFFVVQLKI